LCVGAPTYYPQPANLQPQLPVQQGPLYTESVSGGLLAMSEKVDDG